MITEKGIRAMYIWSSLALKWQAGRFSLYALLWIIRRFAEYNSATKLLSVLYRYPCNLQPQAAEECHCEQSEAISVLMPVW